MYVLSLILGVGAAILALGILVGTLLSNCAGELCDVDQADDLRDLDGASGLSLIRGNRVLPERGLSELPTRPAGVELGRRG